MCAQVTGSADFPALNGGRRLHSRIVNLASNASRTELATCASALKIMVE
jgi:hypothetical protein